MQNFDLTVIAARRKELKLSMKTVANKMGFKSHSVYSKYERGIYKFDANMLPKLAEVLQCDVKFFYH